jgi:peptide/nickel transport system permease protein
VELEATAQTVVIATRRREARRFARVLFKRPVVAVGAFFILVFVIMAIFAPWLAPYEPGDIDLSSVSQGPSASHWLGTDAVGSDTLSKVIFGARTSLIIGVVVVALAAAIGGMLGLLAGYFRGLVNTLIMRVIDMLMAIPPLLLGLVISAMLGGGMRNLIIALTVGQSPAFARLMCAQVMSLRENDYVLAERSLGATNLRVMMRDVLPNSFPPFLVLMTLMLGGTMLAEAGLSFLGAGISAPDVAWGSMISDAYTYLTDNPVMAVAPGVALMLVVFAFNVFGDGLRDALDPRLRGTL